MSRAIDADVLKKSILNSLGINSEAYLLFGSEKKIWKLINDAPTIEPERKKGRWIKKTIKKKIENDYSCSECGRHVSVMRGYDVRLVYPFCHCGAEMTEGEG